MDPILGKRTGRKHQDRNVVTFFAQEIADFVTAHSGQHQIENDQIDRGGVFLNDLQCGGAVGNCRDEIAFGLKIVFDANGQVLLVFDDQDVVHGDLTGNSTSKTVPVPLSRFQT